LAEKSTLGSLWPGGESRYFLRITGHPRFTDQPKVINGVSDLMTEVFGDVNGKAARSAVPMPELPFNIPVEVEMILEVSN
jgi:enamine deaminase RidA (YjgF/YER057c/UK114 family)